MVTPPEPPLGVEEAVDLGTAMLLPGGGRAGGWTLLIDGVPQSFVDLADPTYLEFEYMRWMSHVIDLSAPAGEPLRVLHLGGGALTMPRYLHATRPGSTQRVIERDASLIALVQRWLPLPEGAAIDVVADDARAAVLDAPDGGYDMVIADVYRAAQMPADVTSVQFAAEVARILTPTGRYLVNVADLPPLAFSRRQAATLRVVFTDVCLIAEPGMLRGRRYGNVVFAAARTPAGLPVQRLAVAAYRGSPSARLLHGPRLSTFVAGAHPVRDDTAEDSPAPRTSPFLSAAHPHRPIG